MPTWHTSSSASDWLRRLSTANRGSLSWCAARRLRNSFGRQAYDREWFRTAPLYIVCMKNNSECWTRRYDDKQHGDIDVAIATEHLCLAATERNLGTCWVCNFDTDIMSRLFPSADFESVAIIPIGHIADDCPRAEKKRKALAEIVEEI